MVSTSISLPKESEVESEIESLAKHLTLDEPLPSVKGCSTNLKQYNTYKMDRDKALVLRLLDSNALDGMGTNGLMDPTLQEAQVEISAFLSNENAYDLLSDFIVNPCNEAVDDENKEDIKSDRNLYIKRSFRAMTVLVNDCMKADSIRRTKGAMIDHSDDSVFNDLILDGTRAGLLAKKIFAAYGQHTKNKNIMESNDDKSPDEKILPHIPHLNKLLQSLIEGFPSAVIGAASAGGKSGIDGSLNYMSSIKNVSESASPIPTFTKIITRGCTGRARDPISFGQTQTMQQSMGGGANYANALLITKGHRRKFVRGLSEWGLVTALVNKITNVDDCIPTSSEEKDYSMSNLFHAEVACDALLDVIESICYTPIDTGKSEVKKSSFEESVGEEALLSPLASDQLIQQLVGCAIESNSPLSLISSRAILELFELATSRSKKTSGPPAVDKTENEFDDKKKAQIDEKNLAPANNNKLLKSGLTATIHTKLISNIHLIIEGLRLRKNMGYLEGESNSVRHPGRCIVKHPFTVRRLNLFKLLADILCCNDYNDLNMTTNSSDESNYKSSRKAFGLIMELPMIPDKEDPNGENKLYNPWPSICDLVFAYPENNLFQVQFYRLIHALCMADHEPTFKIIVQKSKFISRALAALKSTDSRSLHGVLLRCLNALRLHSQSISPRSYLREYLNSHDGWKNFQDELKRKTFEQHLSGGGISSPSNNGVIKQSPSEADIDLGSSFADNLGFDSKLIKPYDESLDLSDDKSESTSNSSTKKKKKGKKKKKKK